MSIENSSSEQVVSVSADSRASQALIVLQELVELRELKADIDLRPHMRHVYWMRDRIKDYETRWPLAWEKARSLVA